VAQGETADVVILVGGAADELGKRIEGTNPARGYQRGFAGLIHAIHGENVFCQVDSNGYDSHDFPSQMS
jgi:hypothetical protein